MLGIFTRPSCWLAGGVPLAVRWSVTTKAFDVCCWARNLIALCSAVSISVSSAFFINADYTSKEKTNVNLSNFKVTLIDWTYKLLKKLQSKHTCRSGNLGISANISTRASPLLLKARYSAARCCISTSMQLSYLKQNNSELSTFQKKENQMITGKGAVVNLTCWILPKSDSVVLGLEVECA